MDELRRLLISRGLTPEQADRRIACLSIDDARAMLAAAGRCEANASEADVLALVREPADLPNQRRALEVQPSTFDKESRSVMIDLASETPVRMIDWERWEMVDEVLLMSGRRDDVRRDQLPLLDSHSRHTVENILGSIVDLETTDGMLRARAIISAPRLQKQLTQTESEENPEMEDEEGANKTGGDRSWMN